MRPRNGEFGIYPRKVMDRKEIYYYWVYDSEGKRKFRSTRKSTYEDAVKYCRNLLKKGQLYTDNKYRLGDFTEKFFIYDECPYIQHRLVKGRSYSRSWAAQERRILISKIWPRWRESDLREVTEREIDDWIMSLRSANLGATTVNHIITILKIVFGFAVKEKLIDQSPCEHIEPFCIQRQEKGILTRDELDKLFSIHDMSVWGSLRQYALNLTAAMTGMRVGELLGLRVCMVQGGIITVSHSWNPKDGLKCTKNGKSREIPINANLIKLINELARNRSPDSYLFSDGLRPMNHKTVIMHFYNALTAIGISANERKRRNITFHSYRHGFNTVLLESGMNPETVRLLTGHNASMTARYSHVKLSNVLIPSFQFSLPA